jgi:ABC-type branched-subunit amino acid transport system substrate-binding protein
MKLFPWKPRLCLGVASSMALVLAGCGGSSAPSKHGALQVAVFAPFHGADAAFGPDILAGCTAGADAVNAAGGVMGQKVGCKQFDSGTDPADAVPAATRMVASSSNLEFVLGPADAGPATVPIIEGTHTLDMAITPDPKYDKNTNPYFYRAYSSDTIGGSAMALWAVQHGGYKTAAAVFGEGGSQTEVPTLKATFERHGGKITWLKPLAVGQTSYRTSIEQIAATHPQVIFSELDPQSAATFWSEWLQLVGKLPPIIMGATGENLPWVQSMIKTIGTQALVKKVIVVFNSASNTSSPAYKQFAKLMPSVTVVSNPSQYVGDTAAAEWFDTLQYTSLAMTAAHSTNPSVWRGYIRKVTGAPGPGIVTVQTYAQGVAALKAGKRVTYMGANGIYAFNAYNNVSVPFSGFVWVPKQKTYSPVATLPNVSAGS